MTTWEEWQESPWGRLRYALALANLRRHVAPGSRILDIGGGDGADALALSELGHDVTVVDNSAEMLEVARSRGLNCVLASVWELPDLGPFDKEIRLFTYAEIAAQLDECSILGHYGIRSVCDYITDDDLKHGSYEALEELELALTAREPYMHTARLFQVIAQLSCGN